MSQFLVDGQKARLSWFSVGSPQDLWQIPGGHERGGTKVIGSLRASRLRLYRWNEKQRQVEVAALGGSLGVRGSQLSRRARCHLLHHRQHQLAVAVIQVGGVTADLAQEAD